MLITIVVCKENHGVTYLSIIVSVVMTTKDTLYCIVIVSLILVSFSKVIVSLMTTVYYLSLIHI